MSATPSHLAIAQPVVEQSAASTRPLSRGIEDADDAAEDAETDYSPIEAIPASYACVSTGARSDESL